MSYAIITAILMAAMFLVGALLVVWSRRKTWLRAAAIPLALISSATSAIAVFSTLGFAVPLIGGITGPSGEVVLLSAKPVMGDGIYITIESPGAPRLYWIPWNTKQAEQLQEMLSDPGNGGVKATIPPFEWSWDQSPPSFQPLPQPKVLPDKPVDAGPTPPRFAA